MPSAISESTSCQYGACIRPKKTLAQMIAGQGLMYCLSVDWTMPRKKISSDRVRQDNRRGYDGGDLAGFPVDPGEHFILHDDIGPKPSHRYHPPKQHNHYKLQAQDDRQRGQKAKQSANGVGEGMPQVQPEAIHDAELERPGGHEQAGNYEQRLEASTEGINSPSGTLALLA